MTDKKVSLIQDLSTEARFITEISKSDQWKECNLFYKTVLSFCNSSAFKRSAHFRGWTAIIQVVFFTFIFDCNFLKNPNRI